MSNAVSQMGIFFLRWFGKDVFYFGSLGKKYICEHHGRLFTVLSSELKIELTLNAYQFKNIY